MWKDIRKAGFDGFMQVEFGHEVLALFNIKCIEKISVHPVTKPLNESKRDYMVKFKDEPDVDSIVDKFWMMRHRLRAPQNDIGWWMKKPYSELKKFVLGFDMRNRRERRDIDYRK